MNVMLVQCKPQNELTDSRYQSENLALGYLAATLRTAGFSTKILDAHLLEMGAEETVATIMTESPFLVGFSASAQASIPATFWVTEKLRQSGFQGHVTIGGHFPTYEHQQVLEQVPSLDSVVRGEGEITLLELARHVREKKSLADVPGLTYRDSNGCVIVNQDRPLVDDLDSLPLPHRDTMDILVAKNRRISILSSRGCYAKCSFCSIQTFFNWKPRRVRSTENVVEEMKELYEQGVRKFKFVDDLFMDPSKKSRDWVLELCHNIKEANLTDLNLWLQMRAVCVKEEIIYALVEVGLKKIFIGLESGHAETLKRYRKEITPEQNFEAVNILKKVGVPEIGIGMMIFEPDVTLEGIRENVEFLKKLHTFDIRDVTGRFLPYAGTPLTQQLEKEGRIIRNSWHDIGTYRFADPRVEQLYRMVMTYDVHAKSSLKIIYRMDSQIRKLESYFILPEQQREKRDLFEAYKMIRKDVDMFIQRHGDLMLTLTEDTIQAIDDQLQQEDESFWFLSSQQMFKESEFETVILSERIETLQGALRVGIIKDEMNESIHVAEVKVLPQWSLSE